MKALFVPFAPSLAHVSRCLAVADAWRARNHTAFFAAGLEWTAMIRDAGYEVLPLPEVPGAVFRTDRGFRWLTSSYFRQNLEAEQAILARVEPDVVVVDFRFTTGAAASLAGLPSASILHGNALRLARQPRQTAQHLVGEARDIRGRILHRVFPVAFQAVMRVAASRCNRVLGTQGLPAVHSPFELLLADTILLADLPSLLPPELPPNGHVVGPLVWTGWEAPAPWLEELNNAPLVYVTMGSTVEAQSTLVRLAEALRDAPYNVVLTTGNLSLPPELELPAHIRAFSTVPGATVLRRSAVVVHHGGHETLLQALAASVPSLLMPSNPDQILVAQAAEAMGVGRSLWQPGGFPLGTHSLHTWSHAQIRRELDALLADEECLKTCRSFQQEIAAYHGAQNAARVLEVEVAQSRQHPRAYPMT